LKRAVLITLAICLQFVLLTSASPVAEGQAQTKALNFVYLHGAGGSACSLQLLADTIAEQLPDYSLNYELANPGVKLQTGSLLRCYPNSVDVISWAHNIADSINRYFPGRRNLVLVGHSMGGKAALYAVAHNVGNLADRVAMVVTINSPIKSLRGYYVSGSAKVLDYYRAIGLISAAGFTNSAVYYDSSDDGKLVAGNKHWLSFISAESAPLSPQFNVGGVDAYPRDMDDMIVPISAMYSEGADVIYYGEHAHDELGSRDEVAGLLAEQILRYIFGGNLGFSAFAGSSTFRHQADLFPGTDVWDDKAAEVPASNGTVQHFNPSFTRWQEYEDVVGECLPEGRRSTYLVTPVKSFPFLARVQEVRWFSPDNPEDCRVYIKTRLAPRNYVEVDWKIHQEGLLPAGVERDHYEVEITLGTPFTDINRASWASDDPRDITLKIHSEAESPFRWFQAFWRVYYKNIQERKLIAEVR